MNFTANYQTAKTTRSELYENCHFTTLKEKNKHINIEDNEEQAALQKQLASLLEASVEVSATEIQAPQSLSEIGDEEPSMDFRLFSTAPAKIMVKDESEIAVKKINKRDDSFYFFEVDEEQKDKFASVAVTFDQILSDSQIPWERHSFPKRVEVLKGVEPALSRSKKRRVKIQVKRRERIEKLAAQKLRNTYHRQNSQRAGWSFANLKRGSSRGMNKR